MWMLWKLPHGRPSDRRRPVLPVRNVQPAHGSPPETSAPPVPASPGMAPSRRTRRVGAAWLGRPIRNVYPVDAGVQVLARPQAAVAERRPDCHRLGSVRRCAPTLRAIRHRDDPGVCQGGYGFHRRDSAAGWRYTVSSTASAVGGVGFRDDPYQIQAAEPDQRPTEWFFYGYDFTTALVDHDRERHRRSLTR